MPRGKTKFDRCVKAVRKRGGAYDPRAVCGAMRAEGRLNPSDGEAGRMAKESGGSRKDALAAHIRWVEAVERSGRKLSPSERRILIQRFNDAYKRAARRNPGIYDALDIQRAGFKRGEDLRQSTGVSGKQVALESANSEFQTWWNYGGAEDSSLPKSQAKREWLKGFRGRGWGSKRNPAGAAAEAFKRFHGRDPHEFVTVTKQIHRHGNLWSLGTLRMLKIRTERGQTVKLSGFKGAYLAANEQAFEDLAQLGRAKAQLYIEGGDQSVDLKSFGIDPDRAHEVETLGKAVMIDYYTVKVHLGSEGGDAIYRHKFRTTREGDREVTLRVAKYPDVIYRVLDQQLEFSGGSYEIRAEGIDK